MIQEYNPSIEYTPGKANVIADALSRKAYFNSLILKPYQPELCEAFRKLNLQVVPQGFLANLQVSPTLEDQIRKAQLLDAMVKKVKIGIAKSQTSTSAIALMTRILYSSRIALLCLKVTSVKSL